MGKTYLKKIFFLECAKSTLKTPEGRGRYNYLNTKPRLGSFIQNKYSLSCLFLRIKNFFNANTIHCKKINQLYISVGFRDFMYSLIKERKKKE